MPIIEWNDAMSVGVKIIDREHQYLASLVNDLSDALEAGTGHAVLGERLDNIVDFAHFHFNHEETLFSKTAYPQADFHRREHARLSAQIKDIQERYRKNPSDEILDEVFFFVKKLFMDHAVGLDLGYVSYIREAGFK